MKQAVPSPPRFRSQVFSTSQRFLAQSNFAALFRAAAARRHLLQSLPLAEIVVASRRHQLPGRSPPARLDAPSVALSPPVSPTTTLARSSLDPPAGYEFPFRTVRRRASWSPWASDSGTVLFRQLRRLRSLTPPTSPFQQHGYFTATPGRYSLGSSAPPEHHRSHLGFSNPPEPRGPNTTHPAEAGYRHDSTDLAAPRAR
jgi:hypothetical protein